MSDNIEKDRSLLSDFIELLVVKVPETCYMSIDVIEGVYKELFRKLCHTRIQEFLATYSSKKL